MGKHGYSRLQHDFLRKKKKEFNKPAPEAKVCGDNIIEETTLLKFTPMETTRFMGSIQAWSVQLVKKAEGTGLLWVWVVNALRISKGGEAIQRISSYTRMLEASAGDAANSQGW